MLQVLILTAIMLMWDSLLKVSNNFAYTVGAGVAFPIFDSLNAELAYSWRDFGSTKPKKNSDGENMKRKISYRSHNVSLGLRIDI